MKQFSGGIKNIIFDLGGVLLDLDVNRTINAFKDLGLKNAINPGGWGYDHRVFLDMEHGLLTEDEFRDGIRQLLPKPANDLEIDQAWCAMLVDFAPEKIQLLQQLQTKFQLYLFSNTNSIHIAHFHGIFKRKFGFSLSDLFVKDYYSNEIQIRKPAVESYQFVLDDAGLDPAETLFIDDLDKNIEGAKKAGMQALWLKPEMDLLTVFAD
jgi:putative hydrolase of the HAD superfamily